MALLGLLCVFFLRALHASADTVCDREQVEKGTTVDNCNYYCKEYDEGPWVMRYYENGTKCQYTDSQDGYCLNIPDNEGCYPDDNPLVQEFLKHSSTADTMPPTPATSTTKSTKKPKGPKKPKSTKKPKNTNKTKATNTPKDTKKPKDTEQTKNQRIQRERNKRVQRKRNRRIQRKRNPRTTRPLRITIGEELSE
uniref:Putative basic tail protein n=1 Tax=Amblyomma cajennense TaxID=34607 RepID=A0A023FQN2_AMBCJ